MSVAWTVAAVAAGVFALRLAGLLVPRRAVPPAAEQALRFLPIALLTALVVANLRAQPDGLAAWPAAVGGGLVAWRTRRMWACIVSGLAIYWLLRLV
ncbi:MAG: AzlD domain-containing protein [Sphaerobacter sp.]|nr:AzlD domain-containing protein [Sphaerobacter sp.]